VAPEPDLGPDGLGETQQLPATTLGSPALCTHGESVVVAWTNRLGRLGVGLAVYRARRISRRPARL
jgi:hypothetical protein